jgi:drug/metabolite transporter (DMT)-like permease
LILAMYLGYLLILVAATFWGASAVYAKHLCAAGIADPLLISQARVTFGWALVLVYLALTARSALRVGPRDLWRFALLGVLGMAGSNFLLYFAIQRMDTAVADVIQFTAPVLVALWMWWRGFEGFDRPKAAALALSFAGTALALGAFAGAGTANPVGVAAAAASALCYAFVLVWGKHLSRLYRPATYLHYSMLAAALFWMCVVPPWRFAGRVAEARVLATLVVFAVTSSVIPFACFFAGLKRVPASRAGIVSTFEPPVIVILAWAFLGEGLHLMQLAGIAMVLAAIVIVEAFPVGARPRDPSTPP